MQQITRQYRQKAATREENTRKEAAAKAAAARRAAEELANSVPNTQSDGMMFNANDYDDVMLDAAATIIPLTQDKLAAVLPLLLKLKEFQYKKIVVSIMINLIIH